jgi:quercetin dioxygenase-like cupin family protein
MRWVVGDLVTFKISGEDAAGAFTLGEEIIPPQGGPPPHTHTREDETFYVLEGELEFVVGGRTISAAAGSVVYGPRGIVHSFRNVVSTPSRMVVIITPAGLEEFFEEVGEPVTDPSSPPDGPPDMRGSWRSRASTASRYRLRPEIPSLRSTELHLSRAFLTFWRDEAGRVARVEPPVAGEHAGFIRFDLPPLSGG